MKDKSVIIGPPFSIAELADISDVFDFTKFLPRTFADAEKLLSSNHLEIDDNTFQKCRGYGR